MARTPIIGLTGGIASGKSTVADQFRELGIPVADADEASRAVVAPGSRGLASIVEAFSTDVLDEDGALDRVKLRDMVFRAPALRKKLESILHPLIREWMDACLEGIDAPYGIRMVPLLVETGQYKEVDRVLVVDLPEAVQRQRALSRGGLDAGTLDDIMAVQATREARLEVADDVISNDGGLDNLKSQVADLHRRYLALAQRLRRKQ